MSGEMSLIVNCLSSFMRFQMAMKRVIIFEMSGAYFANVFRHNYPFNTSSLLNPKILALISLMSVIFSTS